MSGDPHTIAKGLGEDARRVLLDAWPISGPSSGAFVRSECADDSLENLGLISWTGMLTATGLAVRRVLERGE